MQSNLLPADVSFGQPLFAIHALAAAVLDERRGRHSISALTEIEFDKLGHCIHLIWNRLHENDQVVLKSTYSSADGIHGPGPALRTNKRSARFLCDVLKHIQLNLLQDRSRVLFSFSESNKSDIGLVNSGADRIWLSSIFSDTPDTPFTTAELGYAHALVDSLAALDAVEIRALGTHQSAESTLQAIAFNVHVLLFRTLLGRSGYTSFLKHSGRQTKYLIDEVARKCERNAIPYESGLSKLAATSREKHERLANHILAIWKPAETIWGDARVTAWQAAQSVLVDIDIIFSNETPDNNEVRRAKAALSEQFGVNLSPSTEDSHVTWLALCRIFERLPASDCDHFDQFQIVVEDVRRTAYGR